jgi:hypothetical protein
MKGCRAQTTIGTVVVPNIQLGLDRVEQPKAAAASRAANSQKNRSAS